MLPLRFPALCGYSMCILTPADLELGTADERELAALKGLVWVISLTMIFSSITHLPEHFVVSFFFTAHQYSTVLYGHGFVIPLSVEGQSGLFGWLVGFHSLTAVNRVAMTMAQQVSVE